MLINRARSLIVGLLQAAEAVSVSSESIAFNSLIGIRIKTLAAMARCLYRTVALHLMDTVVSFLSNSLDDAEGKTLEKALARFVNWTALCEDLRVAVFGDLNEPDERSMAF